MIYLNEQWVSHPLAKGGNGIVFPISRTHVAKIPLEGSDSCEFLDDEYQTHRELYEAGLQVPKPEGIFDIRLEGRIARFFGRENLKRGIVSQRLCGIHPFGNDLGERLHRLKGSEYNGVQIQQIAMGQYHDQINRARELGFRPKDVLFNCLMDLNETKLYLIDFARWERA